MKPYKSSGSPCGSNDRLPPIRANLFLLWISIVTSYFIPDIFTTINIKVTIFCGSVLFFQWQQKSTGNMLETIQNFKCNHICIHSMNLHENFLFVCSAKLSFDYAGLCGNPTHFNICFMFSSRIKSPFHWSYLSC